MAAVANRVSPSPPVGPSPSPRSQGSTPRGRTKAVVSRGDDNGKLPELKSSETMLDKKKPLPTSLQSDFLPQDLLVALSQPPQPQEKLGPPSRYRNLNTSVGPPRKAPASLWGFPNRREKFKHLTDNTPCVCGAGNDISFLYDVPKKEEKAPKVDPNDKSVARVEEESESKEAQALQLPDTLVPDEYHIVKNKGVMGLEYHEDAFGTQPEDHEQHLVMFPSMKPTSRYEVVQLKKTLEDMMDKAGLDEDDLQLKGPTQMHNLLELIKKEQNIYNIIFHELVRQVSIECVERGQLLSEVRGRYNGLLNKVPRQIKGLHEEVLAQRALDRRLTDELMRFKNTIGVLTGELTDVKQHDVEVTKKANQAQEDLKAALSESQKNASLLGEYHDLYELQRKRLETQVVQLSDEKEIWSNAAYSLALKVMEEHSLNTAKRLHVSEKAWAKLATHFTICLSDKDTETLTVLQTHVDKWRDLTDEFNRDLLNREALMREQFNAVLAGIKQWIVKFEKYFLGKEGQLTKIPDMEKMSALYGELRTWGEVVSSESEKYTGDVLLSAQEVLLNIHRQLDGWTDCSMKVFGRHRTEAGENHPDYEDMLLLNEEVEGLLKQYHVRMNGENGVATGLIHLSNHMETWENKINAVIHGANPLPDQEWLRYYQIMDDWVNTLEDTISCVGLTQKEDDRNLKKEHRKIEVADVMRMTQKWLSAAINGIDSEDAKLVESVSSLHTDMVKWMVQMLLRLAPDRVEHSKEAKESILMGSISIGQLQSNAKSLFGRLNGFSKYVTLCCNGIVMEEMQRRRDAHEENADHEYRDLQRLKSECDDWIRTANLMLCELTGEPFPDTPVVSSISLAQLMTEDTQASADTEKTPETADRPETAQQMEEADVNADVEGQEVTQTEQPEHGEQTEQPTAPEETPEKTPGEPAEEETNEPVPVEEEEEEEEEEADPDQLEVIGQDANTRVTSLRQSPDDAPSDARQGTKPRAETPNTKAAYAALGTVDTLQEQLIETEERAQKAEERAANAETDLASAEEKIRALERELGRSPTDESTAVKKSTSSNISVTISEKTPEKSESLEKSQSSEKDKTKSGKSHGPSRSSSKASTKSKKGK